VFDREDTLTGRESESALLAAALDDGVPVLVLGDPGIGKSALLRTAGAVAKARAFRVLTLAGVQSEAAFPFAGLHQMLRPVLDATELLPDAERHALLSAFGLADGDSPDPFLIALAVAGLLAALATDRPTAVLADDVQWLDPQSHQVLAFVARRRPAGVSIIAAVRTGHPSPLRGTGVAEVTVDGVDDAAADLILADHAPALSPAERRRIRAEALGNPLALRELPAVARRSGLRALNLTDRLERAFGGRAAELPEPTRDALLVAAVDPVDELLELLAGLTALSGRKAGTEVFGPAEAAGLVLVDAGRVTFRHPLMRSGVLQASGLARQQAANAALADVLADDPYRRAWHRAQSIVGPDDAIADDLEANAVEALRRGAVMSAITDLERSAQLTTASQRRGHRLLKAAEHAFGLGRADVLQELLTTAAGTDLSEMDQARLEWLREIFNDGTPGDAERVFELCAIAERSDDTDLALNLLLGAALRCWWADTGPAARQHVVAVAARLPEEPRQVAVLAVAEPVLCAAQVIEALEGCTGSADPDGLRVLGMAAHAVGHEDMAADLLGQAGMLLRAQGRLGLLSQVLSMEAMIHLVLGDLTRAAAAAAEGERLATETGQPVWRTGTLVCDSILQAFTGNVAEALRLAAEAELEAARRRLNDLLSCVNLARGAAWLSAGRYRDAYQVLRAAFDPGDPSFHQRERFTSLMYLADAAIRAGQVADASAVVAEMEPVAAADPAPILHVHLAYARAVLADAEELYLEALCRDLSRWPYARAKLELAYGGWLRRHGRPAQGLPLAAAARAAFDRIGAIPWADEARLELHAAAAPVPWPAARPDLAALLAAGLPDIEIADRLPLRADVVALYRRTGPDQ